MPEETRPMLLWFMATVFGTFLVGVADDRFGLSAPTRLGAASVLLLAAIAQVPDFAIGFLLFSGQERLILMPGLVGLGFTLLCFVGLINAVNMADGKNGLVIGQALIWSAILFIRLPEPMRPLIAAIAAALAVLFWFNLRGRLFLGDGGSYGMSALFGLLAIYAWNHGFADMRADEVALIFAVPVFDTIRLIVQRSLRGMSPFTPGRDHLHHYLHARWGWPRPLPWVLALAGLPNLGAILMPGTGLFWLGATFLGYLLMLGAATGVLRPRPA
jgi:UDP-GlcNAc:undecaprenyl-phosphate GlcNAc-1-phosphate transferase